jgi:hypothetical protein
MNKSDLNGMYIDLFSLVLVFENGSKAGSMLFGYTMYWAIITKYIMRKI